MSSLPTRVIFLIGVGVSATMFQFSRSPLPQRPSSASAQLLNAFPNTTPASQAKGEDCSIADLLQTLQEAEQRLSRADGYTALFTKIERVHGEMLEPQVIELKLRHEPFSVYMKWRTFEEGREVLYVEGEHNGDLVAHPGGWKSRVISAVEISPTGSTAMRDTRYPVTKVGMLNLLQQLIEHRKNDLAQQNSVSCQVYRGMSIGDRTATCYSLEFENQEQSPVYRKSVLHLDEKTLMPVSIRNYGWLDQDLAVLPEEKDELTLLESYTYENVELKTDFTSDDFSRDNKQYAFKR